MRELMNRWVQNEISNIVERYGGIRNDHWLVQYCRCHGIGTSPLHANRGTR